MKISLTKTAVALGLAGLIAASASAWFFHFRYALEAPQVLGAAGASEEEEEEDAGARGDGPREWAQFRARQLSDQTGQIDPNGAAKAVLARKPLVREGLLPGLAARPSPRMGGISPANWTWIGPGNIGGRVRAMVVNPQNPDKILIGSASGGIWGSVDGGASWAPANDFLASLSVATLAIPEGNPDVVYAGTGEGFYDCNSLPGAGIFKSVNGGMTWDQLPATNPAQDPNWGLVNQIAVDPTHPETLLAATGGGVRGLRCGAAGVVGGALYRSTDGGQSWARTLVGYFHVIDVKYQPTNPNHVVASVQELGNVYSAYFSTDGGLTWARSTGLPAEARRLQFAFSGDTAFVSVDHLPDDAASGQVWASTNGGASWSLRGTPHHLGTQGWFANTIWADPVDAQHLVVGGLDLWRSTDGGLSWSQISDWTTGRSTHEDQHVIVASSQYNGTSNRTLYFGNDGGVYKTDDIAAASTAGGWTSLNNGLGITQFYDGAAKLLYGSIPLIVGGTQDNGSLIYLGNGTTDWARYMRGDGGASAVDVSDPGNTHVYGERQYLTLHRVDRIEAYASGLATEHWISDGIWTSRPDAKALFIAPFALDAQNTNVLWAGGNSLWRSINATTNAPDWSIVWNAPADGIYISQIALPEAASKPVWFGTTAGTLYASTTDTPVFTQKSTGLPQRMALSLLIDKDRPTTVYAGFGGYAQNNLYRTTDGGTTWENIHGNLPAVPVYSIQRHPQAANVLYVGTEVGVFASEDGGQSWSATNDGPANVPVTRLLWLDGQRLVAVTHGRGMYVAQVAVTTANRLTVSRSGTGSGTVSSAPAGIACGTTCDADFAVGTRVTLTATPTAGSTFTGWSGACAGAAPTCQVQMSAAQSVTASFTGPAKAFQLSVLGAGTGSGRVAGLSAVPGCKTSCVQSFAAGTSLVLSAIADPHSVFAGWTGDCQGTGACSLVMSAARTVTAVFQATDFVLGVTVSGTGRGKVMRGPSGPACATTCRQDVKAETLVTLRAIPAKGSAFAGWSGACSGTGEKCVVRMTSAKAVTARFAAGR